MSGFDLELADRIRAEGIEVVEVAGWQQRGRSIPDFRGFVWHHTACGPNGITPSLNLVINGGANTAPGPLCNVLQSREPDGNDKAFVVAAGTANHAGVGGWAGLSGNSSVWGLEVEHTGVEPLPRHRQDIAIRIAAACLRGVGATDAALACQHSEWSEPPGSKIDIATEIDADDYRRRCTDVLRGVAPFPDLRGIVLDSMRGDNSMANVSYHGNDVSVFVDAQGNLKHTSRSEATGGVLGRANEVIVKGCDPDRQPSMRVIGDQLVIHFVGADEMGKRVQFAPGRGWLDNNLNPFTPPAQA